MHERLAILTLLASTTVAYADEPAAPDAAPPEALASSAPEAQPQPQPEAQAADVDETLAPSSSFAAAPRHLLRAPTVELRDDAHGDGVPPLSAGRLAGEFLIGGLFMVGGTIGGAYIGAGLELSGGCNGEFCGLGGAILGGLAGMTFITPVGVYLIGSSDGETGSFGATVGGSVIGTLAGLGIAAGLENEVGAAILIASPVVGSMIGFNLSRKYSDGHRARRWAPVASSSNGNTSFGVVGQF